jgi:hypothetical protein
MSCNTEDWKAVKKEFLRRFGIRYHSTNEQDYFEDNDNESPENDKQLIIFP